MDWSYFDDAEEELKRIEYFRKSQTEIKKKTDAKTISQENMHFFERCGYNIISVSR